MLSGDDDHDPGLSKEPELPPEAEDFDATPDLGPTAPEVPVPEAPDSSDADAPDGLKRAFWKLVAVFNVAVFALALGPMLAYFRGDVADGVLVFAVGVAFFAYGLVRYRRTERAFGTDHETTDH